MGRDPQIERSILLHNNVIKRGQRQPLAPVLDSRENFFKKYTVLNLF